MKEKLCAEYERINQKYCSNDGYLYQLGATIFVFFVLHLIWTFLTIIYHYGPLPHHLEYFNRMLHYTIESILIPFGLVYMCSNKNIKSFAQKNGLMFELSFETALFIAKVIAMSLLGADSFDSFAKSEMLLKIVATLVLFYLAVELLKKFLYLKTNWVLLLTPVLVAAEKSYFIWDAIHDCRVYIPNRYVYTLLVIMMAVFIWINRNSAYSGNNTDMQTQMN